MKSVGRSYIGMAIILLNTLILLLGIEVLSSIIVSGRPSITQTEIDAFTNRILSLEYYEFQDWAETYWHEHFEADKWDYVPHRLWQTRPYTGETININDNGNRLTHASNCTNDAYRIYIFGGSTIWGYGVPDWNTIPTGMQLALIEDGVCVVNFGELGYTSTQNLLRLSQLIAQGDIPDMVIFYDGANDVTSANRNSIAGGHFYYETIHRVVNTDAFAPKSPTLGEALVNFLSQTATYRLIMGDPPKIQPNWALPPLDDGFVNATIQTYLDNITMAKALSDAHDIEFVAFIQPILFVSKRSVNEEEQQFLWEMPGGLSDLFWRVYPQWEQVADERDYLFYFGTILDTQTERVWIDFNHLNAIGNLAIANEIVAIIRPLIEE